MPSRRQLLISAPLLAACAARRSKVIAVVPKAVSHLFFVAVHAGVKRAAEETGAAILWNGPDDETDHARQIQIVDAMITRRVDALAISATDERALSATVQRAIQAGIPVTIFDSGVNVEGYVTFVATDNYQAGVTAARELTRSVFNRGGALRRGARGLAFARRRYGARLGLATRRSAAPGA